MHDAVGTRGALDRDEGSQRDHVARGIAGLEPDDILGLQPKIGLGLRGDRIGAAEGVEVVDVQRAQVHLHGVEELLHRDALRLRLLTIDVGIDLRHVHLVAGEQAAQRRGLIALRQQVLGLLVEFLEAQAAAILDLHAKPADRAQAHDRRRREHGDEGFLDARRTAG